MKVDFSLIVPRELQTLSLPNYWAGEARVERTLGMCFFVSKDATMEIRSDDKDIFDAWSDWIWKREWDWSYKP